jgi:hypothetical protein
MTTALKQLDREFLNGYYKEMVNDVGEIFELFIEETKGDMVNLNHFLAEKKYTEVAEVLHKVAPCFFNVGIPSLTPVVRKIEADIHDRNYENIETDIKAFQFELNEYMPALNKEIVRLRNYEKVI